LATVSATAACATKLDADCFNDARATTRARHAPALGARGVCTVARVVVVARAASMSSAMQSAASCYYEAKDIFAAPSPRVV
jgi:hypothetical protein